MLHELVFFRFHSQLASYLHSFVSYSYSCKILHPHVDATVRMHSDEAFSSICASRMKSVIKKYSSSTNSLVALCKQLCFGFGSRIPDNQPQHVIPNEYQFMQHNRQKIMMSFNYCSSGSGQNSVVPVVCDVPE